MIEIENVLVSSELLEEAFLCDLNACKGACCVEGEAGAPLEENETLILEENLDQVSPFLRAEGLAAIQEKGPYVKGADGDWETPLVHGKECAYAVFTDRGIAQCGLERAFLAGATTWKKPISCHLYPVRVKEYTMLTAVNYHKWHICDPACSLGRAMKVPVYRFVKDALIRKFGRNWYRALERAAGKV